MQLTLTIFPILLALPAFANPPRSWPADFSATVTLSGVTEREHFTWQDTAWRNDPGVWDLVLIPPDKLSASVPEPSALWPLAGLMLIRRRRSMTS